MIIKDPENYQLLGFRRSTTENKKYDAILNNFTNGKLKYVPFGDKRYQQFKDQTPERLYANLDHNDPKRRQAYRNRHHGEEKNKYSSGYFSWKYLW